MVMDLGHCSNKTDSPRSACGTARGAIRYGSLRREARADGYSQSLVDVMRSVSVAFGVALASAGNVSEVQPATCSGIECLSAGRVRARDNRRWRR